MAPQAADRGRVAARHRDEERGARDHQHIGIADRPHRGGTGDVDQKRDLAEPVAALDLTQMHAAGADIEHAVGDHEELVTGVALRR